MLYLRRIRSLKPNYFINFSRTMYKFCVRCVDNEESIQISVEYAFNGGASRIYNACRPKKENVENSLTRLAQNINKRVNKKKKKTDNEVNQVVLELFQNDGVTKIADTVTAQCGFSQGNVIHIADTKYTVDVNPPSCLGIFIPQSIMVGFPLFPQVDIEFCSLEDSSFLWEKVKYAEREGNSAQECNSRKRDPAMVIERREICQNLLYTPTNDDIGYCLSVTCIPRSGERSGKSVTVESRYEVTAGPGLCPFETRHLYTQKTTQPEEIRVISYNILADIYADQDYSRDVLYPYCPAYALNIDYRKHLIIKELKGYNGDIICLQEVDSKVYQGDLLTAMEIMGFEGVFKEKGGEVREGSAVFFRKSKFRLVAEYGEQIKDILETNSLCADIIKKTYAVPALKEVFQTRTTVLHIVAVEPVDDPGKILLVANTHLYFHPDAGHIRMIQILVSMRYIESLLQHYKKQKPSLIFCGDFNSTPHRAIYEFMTTKSVKEDNIDWKDGGDDQFVPEMNFSHSLNIDSGCGLVAYTNYTSGFNGHLDYIYYDKDSFDVAQIIPPPEHKEVEFHTALPSIVFPSDHIAQVCDLRWKTLQT
ncbi:2',5'-phosphodiesterase 12-like isoform X1 [Mercenaria mercenaria]|uniref:2',5'-phosphodiesterase 12-like isoform X1 n=1 Tax=Mercenaria mercenaria TaxID=6596 RepID=UPI00234F2413|nr:2',5'-phosphodiesterase 12-like isoform X1 [Mercenaria mercenaria]